MASKPSGAAYRKRKAKAEAEATASAKLMCNFLVRGEKDAGNNLQINNENKTEVLDERENVESEEYSATSAPEVLNPVHAEDLQSASEESAVNLDFSDIGLWPNLTPKIRDLIVIHGPKKIIGPESRFPLSAESVGDGNAGVKHRRFSLFHCKRKLSNNEESDRSWLQYSDAKDKVFCFCCKLFGNTKSQLGENGICNWKQIGAYIKQHETSTNHFMCFQKWRDAEKCLNSGKGVDAALQCNIRKERDHWKGVLERLIDITVFLAEHNLAFRGSDDKLFSKNNGNFLGLVQLLGKYDVVMAEHIRRIQGNQIHNHYLSHTIQNEIINTVGKKIKSEIVESAKKAKYFSVILDCTPDISHQDQLSFTLRFVEREGVTNKIRERFLCYMPITESTGENLAEVLITEMNNCGLDMNNCRGQGYDNGANMAGKKKGVQSRILEKFPRAFFQPCGCHSLNLVVGDAASSSVKSVSLFGVLQRLFVLFSSSTKRWKFLKESEMNLSLKQVCETRWECRVQSLKTVRYQLPEICDALVLMQEELADPKAASEAKSLETFICSYDFIVCLIVWYDVLFQINLVSKSMQSIEMDVPSAVSFLEKCKNFLKDYRDTGFESSKTTAKEICEKLGIDPVFPDATDRRRKRQFSYEAHDETPADPEKKFRITVFYPLVDTALSCIQQRFEQLNKFSADWGFLYSIASLPVDSSLKVKCTNLEEILKDKSSNVSDINGDELFDEIHHFKKVNTSLELPVEILNFISKNNFEECFPNLTIALRILLTTPVSVASAERSFSKLKLIKTYLRSTMGQDRLSSLASISIENDVVQQLDLVEIISTFAEAKARKVNF